MLVPLALGIVTYYKTCDILQENAIQMSTSVLENAIELSDQQYEEIDTLCRQVYFTISNSQILHSSNLSAFGIQTKKMKLIAETGLLLQGVNYIGAYYLYLKPVETIITEDSAYTDLNLFYTNNLSGDAGHLDYWRESINMPRKFLTARTETFIDKYTYKNSITFYRSFPFFPYERAQGCIVLSVPQSVMIEPFQALEESGTVYRIVDENGALLYESGAFPEPLNGSSPGKAELKDVYGNEYSMVSMTSAVTGWRFDAATNTTKLFESMSIYRKLYFNLTGIILCVGIVLSIGMAMRAMKPVKLLADRSNNLEQTLIQQRAYLSNNLWDKLLTGEIYDEETIDSIMGLAGISEHSPWYMAISVYINGQVNDAVINDIQKSLRQVYVYCPKGRNIMLCIPLSDISSKDTVVTQTDKAINDLRLNGHFGVGKPCSSLSGFYRSYFEAETALAYARSRRMRFANFESVGGISNYLKPLSGIGEQLMQAVTAGEIDIVNKCLEQIKADYFVENDPGQFVKLQVIYELRHIIIKSTIMLPGEHELDNELISNLSRQGILKNPNQEFENLCASLCAICALREKTLNMDKNQMKANELIEYVNENYINEQLTLRIAAEHYEMKETYISVYFKQNIGVNFVDYLQQLRIDRAIELIKRGDQKIADIAQMTGYANDQTFRRAFKRVIGVSPTAYRDVLQQENKTV